MPNSYTEAIASKDANQWIAAMKAKYTSIIHNQTYLLIDLPAGWCTINARWLFKLKLLTSGLNDHKKARWVIKGYSQVFGINFNKTYTPIMQLENLCLLLTITITLSLHVHAMDIKS